MRNSGPLVKEMVFDAECYGENFPEFNFDLTNFPFN